MWKKLKEWFIKRVLRYNPPMYPEDVVAHFGFDVMETGDVVPVGYWAKNMEKEFAEVCMNAQMGQYMIEYFDVMALHALQMGYVESYKKMAKYADEIYEKRQKEVLEEFQKTFQDGQVIATGEDEDAPVVLPTHVLGFDNNDD